MFLWKTSCSYGKLPVLSLFIYIILFFLGYSKFLLTDCDVLFRRLYILAGGGAVKVRLAWFSRTEPRVHWKSEVGFGLAKLDKMAEDNSYESMLCVKPEVHVYRIPPRASNRGYRYVLMFLTGESSQTFDSGLILQVCAHYRTAVCQDSLLGFCHSITAFTGSQYILLI